ncbi:CdaR family transcriptional regulator [Arthrobacter sp. 18067]|uniref:PucR family transcriptional regulator n=1 Tax=Arthrobacter sp. 18067 TaxID=2681413 RepID=UPI00135A0A71|nr:helix-turn-helix domain-containing protein [Arthrobacter sp. 18067]
MHTEGTSQEPVLPELAELVAWCLEHLDRLAEGYLIQLRSIDGYAHLNIPRDDLQATTAEALELILRKAAGMPVSTYLQGVSEAIGRRRATQGVPLELLLQAVRMVFRLLWTTLQSQATPPQREALDRSAVQLWEAIEFHTVRVHAGYLAEVSRIHRERETEISVILSGFLEKDRPEPARVMHVARTLGLPHDRPYLVMAVALNQLADVRTRASKAGGRAQIHARADSTLVLLPTSGASSGLPSWTEGLRVAAAPPAETLADVPRAWGIAHDLLVSAADDAPMPRTLLEGWPDLFVTAQPEIASSVAACVVDGLSRMADESRRDVLGTVQTYLHTGSPSATADALYCHRNTVLKRLARFKELTGLDPSIPWDAATIRIAFAVEFQGRSSGAP